MMYQFVPTTKDKFGKDLTRQQIKDQIPTHVSVKGNTFDVTDGCIDASSKLAAELATLGFEMRSRPSVKVKRTEPETPQTDPKPVVEKLDEPTEEEQEEEPVEEEPVEEEQEEAPKPSSRVQRVSRKS